MQASTSFIPTLPLSTTGERALKSVSTPRARLTIFAFVVLMTSSVQEAGLVPAGELLPLDGTGSVEELTFQEVKAHFESRLAPAYKQDSKKLARLVLQLSDQYSFTPTFLLSVIETESSYRVNVVSKAGAVGLMQLLPDTAREMSVKYNIAYAGEHDLHDPAVNLRLGVAYLSWLRRQFGHSLHYVAAYNLGPTALRKRLDAGQFELGAIDHYVRTIHERTRTLRGQYGAPVALPAIHRAEKGAVISAAL